VSNGFKREIMKHSSKVLILAALWLTSTVGLNAQSQLLTNAANLSQFPSVERIKAGTNGTDEVDGHARFMAALYLINDMIKEDLVKAPNGGYYDIPQTAQAVQYQYSRAITRFSIDQPPPAARDPRYAQLEAKYEKDPAFFDGLLTQFFSPKFRTDYYAWVRKPVPQQQAAAAVGNPASSDPSILKAKAMKVDIALFSGSITLGDPFSFPACPPLEIGIFSSGPEITTACDATDRKLDVPIAGLLDFLNGLPSGGTADDNTPDPNLRSVQLPPSSIPAWVSGTEAWVRLDQGRIVSVMFMTKGLNVQKTASEDLLAKYGKQHLSKGGIFKTDEGREFSYTDREWTLPGIHVEYDALISDENDRSSVDGMGRVRIETETEYTRRMAEENKPKKRIL
jgi:hypothetical protein